MRRNFVYASLANASDMFVFVLMAMAGRWLGAEEFGTLSYVQALAALGLTLMGFGLDPLIVREFSQNPTKGPQYLFVMLWWKVPVGLVCACMLCVVGRFALQMPPSDVLILALISVAVMLRLLGLGLRTLLRPIDRYNVEAATAWLEQGLLLALGAGALLSGHGLIGLAVALCIARGIGFIVTLSVVVRYIPLAWVPDFELGRNLQRMAIPIGLSVLAANTYVQIDTFLLKALTDYETVGLYNVAFKVFMGLMIVPAIISSVLLPKLSAALASAKNVHNRTVLLGISVSFVAALPISIFGVVFADRLIVFVFGIEYLESVLTMKILFVSLFVSIQLSFLRTLMIAVGRQSALLFLTICALALRLGLGLAFIPMWNIEGAATAVVFSESLVCFGGWIYILRIHFNVQRPKDAVRKAYQTVVR